MAGVATMECTERSAIPDSPCPDVQPDAMREPKMIRKPPMKASAIDTPCGFPRPTPVAADRYAPPIAAKM
eukprot:1524543-Rhodomonas_salina.1